MDMESEKARFTLPRQPGHMDGHQNGAALLIKLDLSGQARGLGAALHTRHGIRAGWTNVHHITSPPVYAAAIRSVKSAQPPVRGGFLPYRRNIRSSFPYRPRR